VRSGASALLPLLRSQTQGDLLALLYLDPEREYTVSEAARRVGASFQSVHHEVSRLVEAGLLADRRQGNNRLVRAVTDSPLSRPLTDLLAVTYGPLPVLTDLLAGVPGVQRAFIYGSWAARHQGEPGPPPRDVDGLVVGDVDLDDLDAVARAAEKKLVREVNIRRLRPEAWDDADPGDAFVTAVRTSALVELDLDVPGRVL
jgi:DNA-binding transcriptional ArsR family regulator